MEEELRNKLHLLLNSEKFEDAIMLIHEKLKNVVSLGPETIMLKTELYGFLIDIGCESLNESVLHEAIKFYESNEIRLEEHITKSSFYYNLANAKNGIARIYWSKNPQVPPISISKSIFQDSINLYWLAFKYYKSTNKYSLFQILINLSNALVDSNRFVEGLQLLDMVLRAEPLFPQALISRAGHLHRLSILTNCSVTTALYSQIYGSYDKGINTGTLPPSILNRSLFGRDESLNTIKEQGFDLADIEKEIEESEKEFSSHSPFRQYCILSFLTLNEHSIYCNCNATKKDNLTIGVKHGMFKGEIVPQLELLLNRMKSEYALSRWLYYQSLNEQITVEYDTMFSELLDGEKINSHTELRRASFRFCYGILDKIALGICKIYGLPNERIHFETFWEETTRSQKLNQVRNIHLNALYSIACDLNTKTGELSQFKKWRNALEHNLLILKDNSAMDFDILKLFRDEKYVSLVDIDDFTKANLHLLQLTRAAIFSFVYCVRLETIHHMDESKLQDSFTIDFKK